MGFTKIVVVVVVILSFCCCKQSQQRDESLCVKLLEQNSDLISFFSDNKNIIYETKPLETNSESLLGDMLNLQIDNENVFVLDNITQRKINVFSMSGDFKYSIGEFGKGDGEYLEIYDFDIVNDEVVVLVSKGKPVFFYYNKSNGNFLRQSKLPQGYSATSMKFLDNKNCLLYNGGINMINDERFNLIATDFNKNNKGLIKKENKLPHMSEISISKDIDSKSYYHWRAIEGEVYKIIDSIAEKVIFIEEIKGQKDIKTIEDMNPYFNGEKSLYILSTFACDEYNAYMLVTKQMIDGFKYYHVFLNMMNNKYRVYKDNFNATPSIQAPFFYKNAFYCLAAPEFYNIICEDSLDVASNPILLNLKLDSYEY